MKRVDKPFIGVAIVFAGAQILLMGLSTQPKQKTAHDSYGVTAVHAEQVKQKIQDQHSPEDFIRPIDAYLAKTPMAGTGKYFYAAQQKTGARMELLMGIAHAETNYNRNPQRGSAYNAFSICSYDSTATTCHYSSYEEAINEAARTLTDPTTPLGKRAYHNIGELSGAHNNYGPVWATSPVNWNRNVTEEVSRITGKPVDHNWCWRTTC